MRYLPPSPREDTVFFPSADPEEKIQLEGKLALNRGSKDKKFAVICHPHPLYGGNLNNKIVDVATRTAFHSGYSTLRFNFRGVGNSEGYHRHGEREPFDVIGAIKFIQGEFPQLESFALLGYSFGSYAIINALTNPIFRGELPQNVQKVVLIAPPLDIIPFPKLTDLPKPEIFAICGSSDQFCTPDSFLKYCGKNGVACQLLEKTDHFFDGHLSSLARYIGKFLTKDGT